MASTISGPAAQAPSPLEALPPEKKGWREVGIIASLITGIRDLIFSLLSKIFSLFWGTRSAPEIAPPLPRLAPRLQEEVNLLEAFQKCSTTAQDRIRRKIGEEHRYFWNRTSYEELGKQKIEDNPHLLRDYILLENRPR